MHLRDILRPEVEQQQSERTNARLRAGRAMHHAVARTWAALRVECVLREGKIVRSRRARVVRLVELLVYFTRAAAARVWTSISARVEGWPDRFSCARAIYADVAVVARGCILFGAERVDRASLERVRQQGAATNLCVAIPSSQRAAVNGHVAPAVSFPAASRLA